jgi:hypothetical protein
MLLLRTVRKIQPRYIHSRTHELINCRGRMACGSQSADDLRAANPGGRIIC